MPFRFATVLLVGWLLLGCAPQSQAPNATLDDKLNPLRDNISSLNLQVTELQERQQQNQSEALREELAHLRQQLEQFQRQSIIRVENQQLQLIELQDKMEKLESSALWQQRVNRQHLLRGLAALAADNPNLAVSEFKPVLSSPDKPVPADLLIILLGDGFAKLQYHEQAVAHYSKLVSDYPDSFFRPKALYQIGMSFAALDQPTAQVTFFKDLILSYPHTYYAKQARKILGLPEPAPQAEKPHADISTDISTDTEVSTDSLIEDQPAEPSASENASTNASATQEASDEDNPPEMSTDQSTKEISPVVPAKPSE